MAGGSNGPFSSIMAMEQVSKHICGEPFLELKKGTFPTFDSNYIIICNAGKGPIPSLTLASHCKAKFNTCH